MFTLTGKDGVSPCVPDKERACGGGGCLDEMVLERGWVSAAASVVSVVGGGQLTQRQCMRVSVALRFNRTLLGSPGRPYMMAQLTLLVSLIWRRRS